MKVSTSGVPTTIAQAPFGSRFSVLVPGPGGTAYAALTTATGGSIVQFSATGIATTLVSFGPSTVNAIPDGGLSVGTDGNFYGAAELPGTSNSIIYKATANGLITPLYTAVGDFALYPFQAADGDLFWETLSPGSIQRLSRGVVTTLFDFSPIRITRPTGPLLQALDGNFYGTGSLGGASNFGGVYKVTPGGVVTDLGSFTQKVTPTGVVQWADGSLYGVAASASANPAVNGFFFQISTAGVMKTIPAILPGVPGSPIVKGTDNNFYGLTTTGGASNLGTFYQVTPAGVVTVVCSLDATTTVAGLSAPQQQLVVGKDHNFYGATPVALFRIPAPSPTATSPIKPVVLQKFAAAAGFTPTSLVAGQADGYIYGTSLLGGTQNQGFLFKLSPFGTLTVLQSFGAVQIRVPQSVGGTAIVAAGGPTSVALGGDGNIYVAVNGGPGADTNHTYLGSVIQVSSAGLEQLSYPSTPGDGPNAIIPATDGTLYGTTSLGGTEVAYTPGVFSGTLYNLNPGLLGGTIIGTAGTYNIRVGNNSIDHVFDDDITTFFDAPSPGTGDWVGLDLGGPQLISAIAFVPRTNFEIRMIGGIFQGSDTPDFSSGVVNLTAPLTAFPADRFNTVISILPNLSFRYVRYLSPVKGFGNINELHFYTPVISNPRTGGGG